ncbi:leucyl aminopeptidase [Endozoicomonas gorgoniicola]|uniref:Probable cytosol aminopeptidase n=1 Tax=Endozoicomonas gorgoniicola TaxID=1234144 RepID=A0ABT3MRE2_9GAMM|nr:leucyl aminopeptidase [Endozoicomonas gorgoniicola]MCW7551941.1 leucyl aminopeptidase [Endozoicomonas gorgoniicola]
MEFVVKSGAVAKQKTGLLVITTDQSGLSPSASAIDEVSNGLLSSVLKRGDLTYKTGKALLLPVVPEAACEQLLLVATGDGKSAVKEKDFLKVAKAITAQLKSGTIKDAMICVDDIEVADRDHFWKVRQLVEAIEYGFYRFDEFKSKPAPAAVLKKVTIITDRKGSKPAKDAVEQGKAIALGRNVARTLGNLPGNVCHPTFLADQAKELAKGNTRLTTKVLGETEMKKLGMNSLLSVGNGSAQESKLILMDYKGGKKGDKPIVLLGKGITFDTGGISLKPGAAMDEMKFDMCGAASILGVMNTIVQLELPLNIVGMIAAAENMPSSTASRPGDIVTSMSGKTIEILNTDAEGRLVLCDALTYAERYKPRAVVDVATLTGACVIALGHHTTGLLSNNDELAGQLLTASNDAADKAWQLPMGEEYDAQLDSNFADMANIGGRPGGTITAACFLARFTEAYPWAHLDIAGTAWSSGKDKGASGRPVPMLAQYLLNQL